MSIDKYETLNQERKRQRKEKGCRILPSIYGQRRPGKFV